MQYLPKAEIENVIDNLAKVADTQDAMTTYKLAGWKSNFVAKKRAAYQESRLRDLQLRADCEAMINPSSDKGQFNYFQQKRMTLEAEMNSASKALEDQESDTESNKVETMMKQAVIEKMQKRKQKDKDLRKIEE